MSFITNFVNYAGFKHVSPKDLHRELWLDLGHTMVGKASLWLNPRMMDVDKAPFYVSIATEERGQVISANTSESWRTRDIENT